MTVSPIYLDYNATTPIDPAVVDAMLPFLHGHFGNPSSTHEYGRRAHRADLGEDGLGNQPGTGSNTTATVLR